MILWVINQAKYATVIFNMFALLMAIPYGGGTEWKKSQPQPQNSAFLACLLSIPNFLPLRHHPQFLDGISYYVLYSGDCSMDDNIFSITNALKCMKFSMETTGVPSMELVGKCCKRTSQNSNMGARKGCLLG